MAGWHHWLNGHGFGWTLGVGGGQGGLACSCPWGSQRVGHNWATELNWRSECLYSLKISLWRPNAHCDCVKRPVKVTQLCSTLRPHGLYTPWNSPGQNTGVGAFPFSRGYSWPRDRTQVSHIAGRFFTSWATSGEENSVEVNSTAQVTNKDGSTKWWDASILGDCVCNLKEESGELAPELHVQRRPRFTLRNLAQADGKKSHPVLWWPRLKYNMLLLFSH